MESTSCPTTTTSSDPQQRGSQMAMLLGQIEVEYRAANSALYGYTPTAKHAYITTRMENMGALTEQLTEMVDGDKDQAMGLVIGCMKTVEAHHAS